MDSMKKPDIEITKISPVGIGKDKIELIVTIKVKNPSFLDAPIKRIEFELFRHLNNGEDYLGRGEKEGVILKADSENLIDIKVLIENLSFISAAAEYIKDGVSIIVRGSIFFDLKIFAPEIKFEEIKRLKSPLEDFFK
ncbi:hypothetical protein L1994_10850 [Methanomicrobium antiquum]|uniref:Water stress and hypersensitive response domain-containing protein n=1 Tax=Methanomicrobium antiquum TaxID=487686 RepID=A0AAF0JLF9_9EURY|nr:hypothetical protein [Methanomicrobium antiquum]WFN36624.1 hypothetical protein L1994_10850 [Methanomicrobium antiquum]